MHLHNNNNNNNSRHYEDYKSLNNVMFNYKPSIMRAQQRDSERNKNSQKKFFFNKLIFFVC